MSQTATATQIVAVDPRTLILEVNVRAEVALTTEFIDSIRQHGVLTPVLVQRDETGALRVRAGQRRTLAAIEAQVETIPGYVVEAVGDESRRIVEQMVENEQRSELREVERVAAFEQLSMIGLSAAQIAKRTGTKRDRVTNALKVAGSTPASTALAQYDMTLDQAAVIAEFEDDEHVVEKLSRCAANDPEMFEHEAQRVRDDREEQRQRAAAHEALTLTGVAIIEQPAYDETKVKALSELRDPAVEERVPLTAEQHATCPGHAAYVAMTYDDGQRRPGAVYACTAWRQHGHVPRWSYDTTPAKTLIAEEASEERRTVLANNKAWRSAEVVRRTWLASFATRKTAPKDASTFIARTFAMSPSILEKAATSGHSLAAAWLGLPEHGNRDRFAALIDQAAPARAQVITLALVLGAIEHQTGTHTWRNGSNSDYFAALAAWGYGLSEVETLTQPSTTD